MGDSEVVAGHSDDALDVVVAGVVAGLEHDDGAALGIMEVVADLGSHQEIVVLEGVLHARAHYVDGLDREVDDDVQCQRQHHDLEQVADERLLLLLRGVARGGREYRHRRVTGGRGRTATRRGASTSLYERGWGRPLELS